MTAEKTNPQGVRKIKTIFNEINIDHLNKYELLKVLKSKQKEYLELENDLTTNHQDLSLERIFDKKRELSKLSSQINKIVETLDSNYEISIDINSISRIEQG